MRPEVPASWANLPFFRDTWPALWDRLSAAQPWAPGPDALFRALDLTPRPKVRVVILGQDPYPTPGRATGLAFSFPPGLAPRDSLKNILTEVAADTGRAKPDGDLTAWARQGVLLLNTALSVPLGQPGGHADWGWASLTAQILAATAADGPRAFLLWGRPAQKAVCTLPRSGHLFLETSHPSPLAHYRGFTGSRPFSATNRWLAARDQPPIDWSARDFPSAPSPARPKAEPAIHNGRNIPQGSGGAKPPAAVSKDRR
jgi:uracil-DNA glycosylase